MCVSVKTLMRLKRQARDQEKIFVLNIADKGLASKIYRDFHKAVRKTLTKFFKVK